MYFLFSDKRFLILGGGKDSHLVSELIDVNSVSSSSPLRDKPERNGATGGLLDLMPILCGGSTFRSSWPETSDQDSCITFKNSQWTRTHNMTTKRFNAESVQLNSTTLWILGGRSTDSTEFITADTSVGIQGPKLPIAMQAFCVLKFSQDQVFVIGGQSGDGPSRIVLNDVYILNPMDDSTHIEVPGLKIKRGFHACGLMSNRQQSKIVVAGGKSLEKGEKREEGGDSLFSVEIFDFSVNNWFPGKEMHTF